MSSFRFTTRANLDIEGISRYIAALDPVAADRFLDRLDAACELFAKNPGLGRPRPELGRDLRSFPVGNYLIFYIPKSEGIDVIRILYGGRDLPALFNLPEE